MYLDVSRPVFALPTLCMILFRERRQELGLRPEVIADRLKLTLADWTKAEVAQLPIDLGLFARACDVMNHVPTDVMVIAERYVPIFKERGWDLLFSQPSKGGQDDLLARAEAFWKTSLGLSSWRDYPVLQPPGFSSHAFTPIVRYAVDPNYRALQDDPPSLNLDLSLASATRADVLSS